MINSKDFDNLIKPLSFDQLIDRRIDKSKLIRNSDGTYDYNGDINLLSLKLESLLDFKFRFRKISGDFYCSNNKLTSLEGAPQEIGGSFDCGHNFIPVVKLKKTIKRKYLK